MPPKGIIRLSRLLSYRGTLFCPSVFKRVKSFPRLEHRLQCLTDKHGWNDP
jgi:hypothetical protein